MFFLITLLNINTKTNDKLSPILKESDTVTDCPDYSNVDHYTPIDNGSKDTIRGVSLYSCGKKFADSIYSHDCRLLIFSCIFDEVTVHTMAPIYLMTTASSTFNEFENIIDNCQFKNCKGSAGAVYINGNTWTKIIVKNCIFENNEGNDNSGGLELDCVYGTIENCVFINNKASTGSQITVGNQNNLGVDDDKSIIIKDNVFSIDNDERSSIRYSSSQSLTMINNTINVASNNNKYQFFQFGTYAPKVSLSSNCMHQYNEKYFVELKRITGIDIDSEFTESCTVQSSSSINEQQSSSTTDEQQSSSSIDEQQSSSTTDEQQSSSTTDEQQSSSSIDEQQSSSTIDEQQSSSTIDEQQSSSDELPIEPTDPSCYVISNIENSTLFDRCKYSANKGSQAIIHLLRSNFTDFKNESHGGAIYASNIMIQFRDAIFAKCISSNGIGGAIYIKNANNEVKDILFENLNFTQCKALFGGAVYIYSNEPGSNVTISSCTFNYNEATRPKLRDQSNPFFGGSAVFLTSTNCHIKECKFIFNKGPGSAFKICNKFDSDDSIFLKNLNQYEDQNSIQICNCFFQKEDHSNSCISIVNDNLNIKIEVNNCLFKGKLNNNFQFYVESNILPNNLQNVFVNSCQFDYDIKRSLNLNATNYKFYNTKNYYFNYFVIVIGFLIIAIISLIIFAINTLNNKHSTEYSIDDSNEL